MMCVVPGCGTELCPTGRMAGDVLPGANEMLQGTAGDTARDPEEPTLAPSAAWTEMALPLLVLVGHTSLKLVEAPPGGIKDIQCPSIGKDTCHLRIQFVQRLVPVVGQIVPDKPGSRMNEHHLELQTHDLGQVGTNLVNTATQLVRRRPRP